MNETPKRGRIEPILDKFVIDKLEEIRQEATSLVKKRMDGDIDDKLAEAIEHISDANAYFSLYHSAVIRAERALKEYRKAEEEKYADQT